MPSENFIVYGKEPAGLTVDLIGGKGVNLALLQASGQPVPVWYGLTTQFMFHVMDAELKKTIKERLASISPDEQPEILGRQLAEIRGMITDLRISEESATMIDQAHSRVIPGNAYFSVRSSAVDEDSAGTSFAGLHDSFLFIRDFDDLLLKIRKVWASAYNERAILYRLKNGIGLSDIRIGVIVQHMVEAAISGIMFTANPNNGNVQEVLISSLYGAGEGIVSTGLEADLYTYNKQDGRVHEEIVPKEEQLVFDSDMKAGLKKIPVIQELRDRSSLNGEMVFEIARAGLAIEKYFETPQDIEFSIDRNGSLYILQTRPITTVEEVGPAAGNRLIWDNSNIIESYSGPTSPMTFSFIRHAYTIVYHCFSEVMGINAATVKQNRHVFENMLGLINGQVYYNIVNWYRLVKLFPGFNYNKAFMESMMGLEDKVNIEDEEDDTEVSPVQKYLVELPKLLKLITRSVYNFWRIEKLVQEFDDHFNTHYSRWDRLDFDSMPPHELMDIYRDMEDRLLWNWKTPIINDFYVMIYYGVLKKLCSSWCNDDAGSLQNDLICGEGDIESTRPTKMLMKISRFVKSDPDLAGLFENNSPQDLADIIPASGEYREVADRVSLYLDKYGFRCINELKLEEPSLRETPEFVYQIIQNYLRMEDENALQPELMEERELKIRKEAEQNAAEAIGHGLLSPLKNILFKRVLRNARRGVKNRENMRFARTKIYGMLRELLNALGKRLAGEKIIPDPHDIYFLTIEEVWDYIKGTAVTVNLKGLIALRKEEFSLYKSDDAPVIDDHFETYGIVYHRNLFQKMATIGEPGNIEDGGLNGTGCSPGEVTGRVKVVKSPRDNLQLNGEILVAGRTDPGWVPLYPAVSGILIERGSILSHSAIVAREMGIPTIVGIPGLMVTLQDGQVVTMNGTTGEVVVSDEG